MQVLAAQCMEGCNNTNSCPPNPFVMTEKEGNPVLTGEDPKGREFMVHGVSRSNGMQSSYQTSIRMKCLTGSASHVTG